MRWVAGAAGLALLVVLLGRELLSRLIFPLLLSLLLLFNRAGVGSLAHVLVLLFLGLVLLVGFVAAWTVLLRLLLRLLGLAGALSGRRIFIDVLEVQRCLRKLGRDELCGRRSLLRIASRALIVLLVVVALVRLLRTMVLLLVHLAR